jgi:hypothetical protein
MTRFQAPTTSSTRCRTTRERRSPSRHLPCHVHRSLLRPSRLALPAWPPRNALRVRTRCRYRPCPTRRVSARRMPPSGQPFLPFLGRRRWGPPRSHLPHESLRAIQSCARLLPYVSPHARCRHARRRRASPSHESLAPEILPPEILPPGILALVILRPARPRLRLRLLPPPVACKPRLRLRLRLRAQPRPPRSKRGAGWRCRCFLAGSGTQQTLQGSRRARS